MIFNSLCGIRYIISHLLCIHCLYLLTAEMAPIYKVVVEEKWEQEEGSGASVQVESFMDVGKILQS